MDEGKRFKPRLCSHHTRVKHLSVFLHIAKSCPYLDWSRSSLLLWVLSRQVCSSTHLPAVRRAPLDVQVLPILCRQLEVKARSQQPPAHPQRPVPPGWAPGPGWMAGMRVLSGTRQDVCYQCLTVLWVWAAPVSLHLVSAELESIFLGQKHLATLIGLKYHSARLALLLQGTNFSVLADKPLLARSRHRTLRV